MDANGVSNDDDGDGVCNSNDICAGGDDLIDSDGDGIPDFCDIVCSQTTSSFDVSQLTHSGGGSGSTTLILSGGSHTDVSFSITEINSRLGGKPGNRFNERVVISYVDGNGVNQTYGTYLGSTTSSVNVSITEEVQSIQIDLSDAYDGNSSTVMRITLSTVSSCVALNCSDSDGDGVCDADDICDGFDDNLIGTSCDDGNACTINDVYTTDCGCEGTYADSDGDGVCDGDDLCPGGDDNLDLDGNGIPDDCDCTNETGSFSPSTLLHSGAGSNAVSFNFTSLSKDVTFDITGLDGKTNGNPRNRYDEVVTVTYIDSNGQSQSYGSFSGALQNTASVIISEFVSQVTVSLSNGVSGSSAALSVDLSSLDYCSQNAGASTPMPGERSNDDTLDPEKSQIELGDLSIYPNPASTEVNVSFTSPENSKYSIQVKSILGQSLYQSTKSGNGQISNIKLDASSWDAGIYFVIVNVENSSTVKKVIIQK